MCLLNRFAACLALPNMIVASERFEVRPIKEKQAPSYTNVAADQSRSAHFVRGGAERAWFSRASCHVFGDAIDTMLAKHVGRRPQYALSGAEWRCAR